MKKDNKEFEKRCRIEERNALKNMELFWYAHGKDTVAKFSELTKCWSINEEGKGEPEALLQERLESSPILILTANHVEANMMVRLLSHELRSNKHDSSEFSTITTEEGYRFHFGFIGNNRVAHVQPIDMAAYTENGSFSALDSVLKRYKPQLVISIGVAFGNDATKQNLGDVLVSKHLFPYDSINKYSEKSIKLKGKLHETDSRLLGRWRNLLEYEDLPKEAIENYEWDNVIEPALSDEHTEKSSYLEDKTFKWYFGTVLSGGSVVDEVEQKVKLIEAAERRGIEDLVGGEMEGSGVYFACAKEKIPCIVIKGICDWGIKKNSWEEILKKVPNSPDNDTVKDSVQALAFINAFTALRCLLKYDNSMISEDGGVRNAASVSNVRLFTMKSLERIMMRISTFRFPPYFILGTAFTLLSFLCKGFSFEILNRKAALNFLIAVLSAAVGTLVLEAGLLIFPKASKRYKLKTSTMGIFPILIFGEANLLLFTVNIYARISGSWAGIDIYKSTTRFQFVYGVFLCAAGIVWVIAACLRARPENLELLFANFTVKNLNFEKCCCIIQNTSETTLYCMSVGWICKTQLSPVKIHKCGTIQSQTSLLVTSQDWDYVNIGISLTHIPEDFCPITPDTLQVNYRMPNGDLVVHIITKTPKDMAMRDSVKDDGFCTRYMEQIFLYRDETYKKVLKRICNSQIIS